MGIDLHFKSFPMPQKVKGFLKNNDGNFLIVVNSNISQEAQKKAIEHEVNHLVRDDLYSDDELSEIERRNK